MLFMALTVLGRILTASCWGYAGPASLQAIQTTDAVGYCTTSLDYRTPVAGEVSEVDVAFECWTAFEVGEAITFFLPGFELGSDANVNQTINGSTCSSALSNQTNGTHGASRPLLSCDAVFRFALPCHFSCTVCAGTLMAYFQA